MRLSDFAALALRIGFGLMMILRHGYGKIVKYDTLRHTFADPLGVGTQFSLILTISAEFYASILLILGLFTRPAAFVLFFTMSVAALVVHAGDPLKSREMAILYAIAYAAILIAGPGRLSVDRVLSRQYEKLPQWIGAILHAASKR